MRIIKGKCHIAVEQIDGFGKYPGLWIGRNNISIKVASFGNNEKAEAFSKWLKYMFDNSDDDSDLVGFITAGNAEEKEGNNHET